MEARNREESAIYGEPGPYGDIMKHTKEIKQQEGIEKDEILKYEKGFLYIPEKGANYAQSKRYTEKIVKGEILHTLT